MNRVKTLREMRELCKKMYDDYFEDEECNCELMEVEEILSRINDLIEIEENC